MKLRGSLDWSVIQTSLWTTTEEKIKDYKNKSQVKQMLTNIGTSVTLLSKIEVEARRTRSMAKRDELLERINNDIELVEEYILVAALIG